MLWGLSEFTEPQQHIITTVKVLVVKMVDCNVTDTAAPPAE